MVKRGTKSRWSLKDERRLLQFASNPDSIERLALELERSIDSILKKSLAMGVPLKQSPKVAEEPGKRALLVAILGIAEGCSGPGRNEQYRAALRTILLQENCSERKAE
jgi:hypothetical protein